VNNLKEQFLNYLRSVKGAESVVSQGGFPPVEMGPNYPAFSTRNSMNDMLGGMSMGMRPQGGLGGPALGGAGPQPTQRLGGPRGGLQDAQNILLRR